MLKKITGAFSRGTTLDLTLIFCAACAMCWWTWATWCDPLVDWGAQLYLAWQVSAGRVLYRDIAYPNGPLSVYFNAALMWTFGANQRVIWCANLVILGAVIVMFYVLLRQLGGRLAAVGGNLVFVCVFAFSQYVVIANYNFVTPYAQEVTHGLAL